MWVKNNCIKISKNNFQWSHNVYRWNLINNSIKARDEHIQEQSCIFLKLSVLNINVIKSPMKKTDRRRKDKYIMIQL